MKKQIIGALAMALCSLNAGAAQATDFTVHWSGDNFGNGATAIGLFDIDTSVGPDLGGSENPHALPDPAFQILSLTVTGTAGGAGDGTYSEADFASYVFAAFSPLDYTKELIGQPMTNGCSFGDLTASCREGPSGDFNLFPSDNAPVGTDYFTLTTVDGKNLNVTSIAPSAVPEPSAWAMMLAGFGMIGFVARRRQNVSVTYA